MSDKYVYRCYLDPYDPICPTIYCEKFKILRETEKCYFIDNRLRFDESGKRILKSKKATRAFARTDKKQALCDFIARYKKHIRILQSRLDRAKYGLEQAEIMLKNHIVSGNNL